jgi:type 1 glutamine amidotransferase
MPVPILLVSSGFLHPNWLARQSLAARLKRGGEFAVTQASSLEELLYHNWQDFRAVVLYIHQQTILPPILDALDEFIREGGGLLAIHSASASFPREEKYTQLLGGRFTTHGPVETFRVEPDPDPSQRDLFGVTGPFTLRDELYQHTWDPENRVHFWAITPTGHEPLVWSRFHGNGRVCYCAAGHTAASLRCPQVVKILARGLIWVTDE